MGEEPGVPGKDCSPEGHGIQHRKMDGHPPTTTTNNNNLSFSKQTLGLLIGQLGDTKV